MRVSKKYIFIISITNPIMEAFKPTIIGTFFCYTKNASNFLKLHMIIYFLIFPKHKSSHSFSPNNRWQLLLREDDDILPY